MAKSKIAYALSAAAVTLGSGVLMPAAWATSSEDFMDCIKNDTESLCVLTGDAIMDEWIQPMRDLTIDLNGYTLTTDKAFTVYGIELNITGNGVVEETDENNIPFYVYGSRNESDSNFTVLNIDSGVTVRSPYYGFFVPNLSNHAYGVVMNFGGRLEAQDGITINGNIQDVAENAPQVNILDGASIVASGHPIYAAGYGHWNIGAATISGSDGVGIKAGTFNFVNTSVTTTGEFNVPVGYNNGIYSAGVPIQIESNDGYADNVEININGGEYVSEQGAVVLEYKAKADTQNTVKTFEIAGGTFTAGENQDVFYVSDGFTLTGFVSGGVFNEPFDLAYLAEGYSAYEKPQDVWTVDLAEDADLPSKIMIAKGETYAIRPGEIIAKYLVGGTVDKNIASSDGLTITGVAAGETAFTAQLHEMGKGFDLPIPVYVYDLADESAEVRVEVTSDEMQTSDVEEEYPGAVAELVKAAEDKKIAAFYDIKAMLYSGDELIDGAMPELGKAVLVTFDLPENLPAVAKGFKRNFFMIRFHNGEASDLIPVTDNGDGTGSFENAEFSAFALVYEDVEETEEPAEAASPETGTMTAAGASASVAAMAAAVAVGILTSIVSFAYLVRRKG